MINCPKLIGFECPTSCQECTYFSTGDRVVFVDGLDKGAEGIIESKHNIEMALLKVRITKQSSHSTVSSPFLYKIPAYLRHIYQDNDIEFYML